MEKKDSWALSMSAAFLIKEGRKKVYAYSLVVLDPKACKKNYKILLNLRTKYDIQLFV